MHRRIGPILAVLSLYVVSVNKRAERDLTKEFIGQDIDWLVIAEKLES